MGAQCSQDAEVAKTPKRKKQAGSGAAATSTSSKKHRTKAAASATAISEPRTRGKVGGSGKKGSGKTLPPQQETPVKPGEEKQPTTRGSSSSGGRKARQVFPSDAEAPPSSPNPLRSPPPTAATAMVVTAAGGGGQKVPIVQSDFVASLKAPLKTVPMTGTYAQEFTAFVKSLEGSPKHDEHEPQSQKQRTTTSSAVASEAATAAQSKPLDPPLHADLRPESRVSQATVPAVVDSLDLTPPRPPPPPSAAFVQAEDADASETSSWGPAPRMRSVTLVSSDTGPAATQDRPLAPRPSTVVQNHSPAPTSYGAPTPKVERVAAAPAPSAVRTISLSELSKHNSTTDAWVAVRGTVFDITSFIAKHPGGRSAIFGEVGQDATRAFEANHGRPDAALSRLLSSYKVGLLQ